MFSSTATVFLLVALTCSIGHGRLTLYTEKKTWSEAQTLCSRDGGSLVDMSTNASEEILDMMANSDEIHTIWEGRYYSPWAWLLGCFRYNGSLDSVEIKNNQMKECLNHCNTTNYFGLQNKKCFCFNTFYGPDIRTEDFCKHECPGDDQERCGGYQALTVYMNDLCYEKSTEWQGTVSRTRTGQQCLPWANVTEVQRSDLTFFPDGSAKNASNFCRDPVGKTFLWCYVSQTKREQCDIPPCINLCYEKSTEWQGTVSRTRTGQQCLPWANVTEVQRSDLTFFPDGSAKNASNFCRDPVGKTFLWCYVSQTKREQCDIPPCIKNDGVFSCMSFKIPVYQQFKFKQESCESTNNAICSTSDNAIVWNHNRGNWTYARDQSRRHEYKDDSDRIYQCSRLAGPEIFGFSSSLYYYHWLGYSRGVCTVSETVPNRKPKQCYRLDNNSGIIGSKIVNCDERNAFVCQYAPVTCGKHFNTAFNGSFKTPGYGNEGYGEYQRCVWTISAPEDHYISLSLNLSIEDTYMCRNDFLRVFEDSYENGASVCGEIVRTLNSTGSNVTIEFRSDGSDNDYRGARVTWSAVPTSTAVTKEVKTQHSIVTTSSTSSAVFGQKHSNEVDNGGVRIAGMTGGTFASVIAGALVASSIMFGVAVYVVRRRNKSDEKETTCSNNTDSNSQAVKTDHFAKEERPSSEIYQNTSVETGADLEADAQYDNLNENVHMTMKEIQNVRNVDSVQYHQTDQQNVCSSQADTSTDVYNTLNETKGKDHQNQNETVYNHFTDTNDLYDHTETLKKETKVNNIAATDQETYDHLSGDYHTQTSTSQKQVNEDLYN